MNDSNSRAEYFPIHGENGNGGNNGGGKIFTLQKTPDPDQQALFEARERAGCDRRLTDGAARFFVWLIDRCLNSRAKGFLCRGAAAISDSLAAGSFGVWEKTIYNWKRSLETEGYVWTSKKFRTDRWPITVYNISAVRPRERSTEVEDDGSRQGGTLRTYVKNLSLGARQPDQLGMSLPGVRQKRARKNVKNPLISAAIRNFRRLTTETTFGSQPNVGPVDNRNQGRLTTVTRAGCQPNVGPVVNRTEDRLPTVPDFRHKRDSVRVLSSTEKKGEGTPSDLEFEEWKLGLRKKFQPELERLEARFASQLKKATTPEAKQEWKRRLSAVKSQLDGGSVADEAPQHKPVTQATAAEKPLSAEERAEHARFMADHNRRKAAR